MATISPAARRDAWKWYEKKEHPMLISHFSRRQQERLLRIDQVAGQKVVSVLVSIVLVGMVGMATIVAWLALMS